MSTHHYTCCVCGGATSCADASYWLAITDGCDHENTLPRLFFCSVACFVALEQGMAERRAYTERMGEAEGVGALVQELKRQVTEV